MSLVTSYNDFLQIRNEYVGINEVIWTVTESGHKEHTHSNIRTNDEIKME